MAMTHGPEELEVAQISHSLALVLSGSAEPQHNGVSIHRLSRAYKGLMRIEALIVFFFFFYMSNSIEWKQSDNSAIEDNLWMSAECVGHILT